MAIAILHSTAHRRLMSCLHPNGGIPEDWGERVLSEINRLAFSDPNLACLGEDEVDMVGSHEPYQTGILEQKKLGCRKGTPELSTLQSLCPSAWSPILWAPGHKTHVPLSSEPSWKDSPCSPEESRPKGLMHTCPFSFLRDPFWQAVVVFCLFVCLFVQPVALRVISPCLLSETEIDRNRLKENRFGETLYLGEQGFGRLLMLNEKGLFLLPSFSCQDYELGGWGSENEC